MKKVDFAGKRYIALAPVESLIDENGVSENFACVGDEIHSIEHTVDESGNHLGFEFLVGASHVKVRSDLGRVFMVESDHSSCKESVRVMERYFDLMAEAKLLLHSVTRADLPTFVKYFQAERKSADL